MRYQRPEPRAAQKARPTGWCHWTETEDRPLTLGTVALFAGHGNPGANGYMHGWQNEIRTQ